MKKLLLLAIVVLGGVMFANAATKRFYIEVQSSYWTTQAQSELNLFLKSGSDLNTWPGDACTRIGETNWYYIDVNNDNTSATCIVTTKDNGSTWQSNEVSIDLSKKNIIYLYDEGGAKLSVQSYDKFVLAKTDFTQLASLTQDDYVFKGTVDFSSEAGDTYFALFTDNSVGAWNYCFRPVADNNYELREFVVYPGNTTTANNGKTWLEKQNMKYNVVFNLVEGSFTFTPYFERTITDTYSTFSSDYAVAIPDGLNAYYVASAGSDKVNMTKFNSGIRSTDGAFLQVVTASSDNKYKFTPASSTDDPTTNLLLPTTEKSIAANNYVFASGSNGLGFYKLGSDLSGVGKGKAYLAAGEYDSRLSIVFGGEASGINKTTMNASNNDNCFDLQGRRVAQPTKGLYIVNGKKVIMK